MKHLSIRRKIQGLCLAVLILVAFAGFDLMFHDKNPLEGVMGIAGPADTDRQAEGDSGPVRLKWRLLMILVLISACSLACLFFVTGRVLTPLEGINRSLEKMAEGDLNEKTDLKRDDEVGRTCELINEFSINFQETLLYFWNHACSTEKQLDEISFLLEAGNLDRPELAGKIEALQNDMAQLQRMIQAYTFYGVKVENDRLMDNTTVTQNKTTENLPDQGPEIN